MKKCDKAVTTGSIMTVNERKDYLNKIPWVIKHKEELKSLNKGNMFLKIKEMNSEVSLYPSSVAESEYVVVVHTTNNEVRNYMNNNKYVPDEFNQNYVLLIETFSEAVSLFIKLSREIRNLVQNNDKLDNKDIDRYSTDGIRLTVKEIKERVKEISDVGEGKSILNLKVNSDGYIIVSAPKIKYGCPLIRLIPKNKGIYYVDIIIDKNLDYRIKYDLEEYLRSSLGFVYSSGVYRLVSDRSFNSTFNKFRDIARDTIVFILNHEVFKLSTKKYGPKKR